MKGVPSPEEAEIREANPEVPYWSSMGGRGIEKKKKEERDIWGTKENERMS